LSSTFSGCNSDFFDGFQTGRAANVILIGTFGFFVPTGRRSTAFCDPYWFHQTAGWLFPILVNPTTFLFVILDL
jgi:hypothetical protein